MKGLRIIGITGTNGKTTTAFLIYHLLKALAQKVSLIGTIKYIIGSKVYKARLTTPGFSELAGIMRKIKAAGSRFVVMEVSSHALIQGRVKGLKFSRCLFTNLSRDHLDYHKTMLNYFNAKAKLFLSADSPCSLINIDDKYGRKIFKKAKRPLSFAIKSRADFRAEGAVLKKKNSCFDLVYRGKSYPVKTHLVGCHNILNILGAAGLVFSLGFPLSKIVKAVSNFRPVEGRLKSAASDIFIDYAHTPDALGKALEALRQAGYKKIICLFGCGGDRDKGKRRLMGRIASLKADFTFITSDNPRSEEPAAICLEIAGGFKANNYSVIVDRGRAIKEAVTFFLKNKTEDSCLLIAGKGHEEYQIIKDKRISFKDGKVVKEILKKSFC